MKMKDLTPHEQEFISAYRTKPPEAQQIIDDVLGVKPNEYDKGTKIYKIQKLILPVVQNDTVFVIMAYFDWNTQKGYQLPEW